MNIPDIIVFVAMSIFITILLFLLIAISVKNRRLVTQALQAEIDRMMTVFQIEKFNNNNDNVEKTEGFVKFISDSRDWAFNYIEEVQVAIKEYDEALSKDDAAKLNEAYKKLISMLPDDDMVK